MTRLQEDLLEIYNNLVELSDSVLGNTPCPISVSFDVGMGCLSFKCHNRGVYLRSLNYYISRPDLIKDTFLLPEDYDYLMNELSKIIKSGKLIQDRICVSPEFTGFDLFLTDTRNIIKGAQYLSSFRFISGQSKWFKWKIKKKYKNVL